MATLHNNYIFLPKTIKENQSKSSKIADNNTIYLDVGRSVYSYIKEVFGEPVNKDVEDRLFKSAYTYEIKNDKISYNVIFTILNVIKYTYLDICVSEQTNNKAVQALANIQNKITNSGIEDRYVMIISYDSISEYYCNKAYPKLNKLERNLRKLLLNTYTVNFGAEYYQTTIAPELQNKIKGVIQAKGNEERKKTERLKKFFYSMEFSDIQTLLFAKKWTKFEEDNKTKFLLQNANLTELSETELRTAFEKFSPKSDWERLFADKANNVNIEELIETIRENRNDIAHCKFFYQEQYNSFNQAANLLNRSIVKAIKITEEKDFNEKNAEAFRIALAGITDTFTQFKKQVQDSFKPMIETLNKIKFALPSFDGILNSVKTVLEENSMNLPLGLNLNQSEKGENEGDDNHL